VLHADYGDCYHLLADRHGYFVRLSHIYARIAGTAAADDSDGEELSAEKEAELEREATKRAQTRQAAAREMPYVMPCPQSMEELLELLAKHAASAADANTVVSHTCSSNDLLCNCY
jgi:Nop14-like family